LTRHILDNDGQTKGGVLHQLAFTFAASTGFLHIGEGESGRREMSEPLCRGCCTASDGKAK
jgi:hypothetical protein